MNGISERAQEEIIMAQFEVVPLYFHAESEKIARKPQGSPYPILYSNPKPYKYKSRANIYGSKRVYDD
jgi:ABC-type oligopeptide transport system substrate-binding subunit